MYYSWGNMYTYLCIFHAYLYKYSHILCYRQIHGFVEQQILDNLGNERKCAELLIFINNMRSISSVYHISLGDIIFRGIKDRIQRAILRRGANYCDMSYVFKFEYRNKTSMCSLYPECNNGNCALMITGRSVVDTNLFFTEIVFCPLHYKRAFKSSFLQEEMSLNCLKLKRKQH